MNLEIIRQLSEKRSGGLKKLATDVGMSEQNLHRCIRNNKIQAGDLEEIAKLLGVDICLFFDNEVRMLTNNLASTNTSETNVELLELCKSLVANYQQRDDVMNKLVSMVKGME